MAARTRPRSAVPAAMGYGQRPWPGIAAPDCHYCSWAYRGRWPFGRMEVKYLNAMCSRHAHRVDVTEITTS